MWGATRSRSAPAQTIPAQLLHQCHTNNQDKAMKMAVLKEVRLVAGPVRPRCRKRRMQSRSLDCIPCAWLPSLFLIHVQLRPTQCSSLDDVQHIHNLSAHAYPLMLVL